MADQGAEGFFSPFLRKKRIKATSPFFHGCLLDVGCGSGELADLVKEDNYIGFDIDKESIAIAKNKFPNHTFINQRPINAWKFDTIVSMAVIEHSNDPESFLKEWSFYLKDTPESKFVLTTPHPRIERIHTFGANIGLFSKHGSEEHEELINYEYMQKISKNAGLKILTFKKFLLGMNQLFVLIKR